MRKHQDENPCTSYRPVGSYSFTPYDSDFQKELLRQEIRMLKTRIAELEKQLKPERSRKWWLPETWLMP